MTIGKLTRYGLPLSNVAPTGTATNNITPGQTLEVSRFKLGGTALTRAMIQQFRIRANGKVIVDTNGTDLQKINDYRGVAGDVAFMDYYFADYALNNELDRMVGAFDTTYGIGNITQEIKIVGATAPVITPILIQSGAQKNATGEALPYAPLISKLLQYPFNISVGGRLQVPLPFGPQTGGIIKRVHVVHSGNMTGVTVKENATVVHESLKAENEYEQKRFGRVPQANTYTVDFVVDGDMRKAMNTRQSTSMEWLLDFSAADSGTVYVEYLDPLGNL
jgi:hypothetical protein